MSPEDFRQTSRDLFGKGWQTRLVEALGVDGSTVRRWVGSGVAVPPAASAYLSMMCERQGARGALVYAGQTIGLPVATTVEEGAPVYEKLVKPLLFPGVPDRKRMPSIHADPLGDGVAMALRDEPRDAISETSLSYVLTRHPDPWHLASYREAALAGGHATAVTRYGDHHYTLLAHRAAHPPLVLHHIATHAAVGRLVWSPASAPSAAFHSDLT